MTLTTDKKTTRLIEAAQAGNAVAQYDLATRYQEGSDVEQSLDIAIQWFQQSADQGNIDAQCVLGSLYHERGDIEKAIAMYKKAADQDNLVAQNNLSLIFMKSGQYEDATYWAECAAKQGDTDAQYDVGVAYENGIGVKPSGDTAAYWYGLAASSDHKAAAYNLARLYLDGSLVKQNESLAINILIDLATKEYAPAQFLLGLLTKNGLHSLPQDNESALGWFSRAARNNMPEAFGYLGLMYLQGEGTDKNLEAAFKCFEKCAISGVNGAEIAQYNLASLLYSGEAGTQSYGAAHVWMMIAAKSGYKEAIQALAITEKPLLDDDKKRAIEMSSDIEQKIKNNKKNHRQ